MNKELQKLLLQQQEQLLFHKSIKDEFNFYKDIQSGNTDILLGDMDIAIAPGMGILSNNHLRNLKYHLIILVAMVSRFCIEGGMDIETAYTMSDMYIRQADIADNEETLSDIKKNAISSYTLAMHNLLAPKSVPVHVSRAMDYIQQHITEPVNARAVADYVQIHPDYLTKLFKKETGMPLVQYILFKKCEMAKYMLCNSNASCTEIGFFLGFSSCSHFISRFKSLNGMTPAQYRKNNALKLF